MGEGQGRGTHRENLLGCGLKRIVMLRALGSYVQYRDRNRYGLRATLLTGVDYAALTLEVVWFFTHYLCAT
jgi:hypothetical protein